MLILQKKEKMYWIEKSAWIHKEKKDLLKRSNFGKALPFDLKSDVHMILAQHNYNEGLNKRFGVV